MSQPPISDANKLAVLFKRFQGTAQAKPGYGTTAPAEYDSENYTALSGVFSSSVFVEPVPTEISGGIASMAFDANIADSSWNSDVWDQTISSVNVEDMSGNPIPHLKFYKRVYLKSVNTDPNSWWLPESSLGSTWATSTNRLRNMIPWLHNSLASDQFTPVVEYHDGNGWTTTGQNADAGWVIDYNSGIVVFYNTPTSLSQDYNLDGTAADTTDTTRPRISFIRYEGKFLDEAIADGTIGGGGGSGGAVEVGQSDSSGQPVVGTTFDASSILFNEDQFSLTDNSGQAVITLSQGASVSDISRYFFDIPPAPFGGDISAASGSSVAALNMIWQLPVNYPAAVPLGRTQQYVEGSPDVSDNANVNRLPFFRALRIDAMDTSVGTNDPRNQSSWVPIDTSNNQQQPFFPPSLTRAIMNADGTSGVSHYELSGNYPFTTVETDQVLTSGSSYQFRIYLTNDASGTAVDPTYGHTTPWNYYYLPEGSGNSINVGSFGPPTAPTMADISNSATQFDAVTVYIRNNDPSGADASYSNVGWPIPPSFDLSTRFGGDVDGVPISNQSGAKQMPNIRQSIQDSSAEILGPWGKNGILDIGDIFSTSDLSYQSSNWLWYPETKYTLSDVYMQNNTVDFSNQIAAYQGPDSSCVTLIPSRSDVGAATQRFPSAINQLRATRSGGAIPIQSDAYPQWWHTPNPDTLVEDVLFITNAQTFSASLLHTGAAYIMEPFANNSDVSGGSVGLDSSGVTLTSFEFTLTDSALNAVVATENTNAMRGFLDVSFVSHTGAHFSMTFSADEGATAPTLNSSQRDGYYTDISIMSYAELTDICLNAIPDICNNQYQPYTFGIQDICGSTALESQTGPLLIGQVPPTDILYIVPASVSITPTLDFTFFGQALPKLTSVSVGPPSSVQFDISGIDLWWRRDTKIASVKTIYNNASQLVNGADAMNVSEIAWSGSYTSSMQVAPALSIEPSMIWDVSDPDDDKRYSRHVALAVQPQFAVYIAGSNNVTKTPANLSANYSILFANSTDHMFWDYTWDSDPNGNAPSQLPSGFFYFVSNSPQPSFSGSTPQWVFLQSQGNLTGTTISSQGPILSHWPNKMPPNQLLWADHAFRGADASGTTGLHDPYYDFSNNFYNPSVTIATVTRKALLDYSGDKTTGSQLGETFFRGTDGWHDNVNTPSTLITYNDLAKYITFRTWMPPVDAITSSTTSTVQGYRLVVKDVNGNQLAHVQSTTAPHVGYWVYHVEIPPVSPAQYVPFTGQKVAGSSPIGCYSSAIQGYKVSNTVPSLGGTPQSQTNLTIVEISIGLTIISPDSIASVGLEWVAN